MKRVAAVLLLCCAAAPARAQDMPLSQILVPGEGWREAERLPELTAAAVNARGDLLLATRERVQLRDGSGKIVWEARVSSPVTALAVGPDGAVFASQPMKKRLVRLEMKGEEHVVVEDVVAVDLVVTGGGAIYCTSPADNAVYRVAEGKKTRVTDKVPAPTGLTLWPGGGTLVVASAEAPYLWAFRIERDGGLSDGERYYPLRARPKQHSQTGGLTQDSDGRLYAATPLGVQVFDPTGRLSGVLLRPEAPEPPSRVLLGGPQRNQLFAVCGDRLFARTIKAKAVGEVEKPKP